MGIYVLIFSCAPCANVLVLPKTNPLLCLLKNNGMIIAEAKFYIVMQAELLEEHYISVWCMTLIHTTSQPAPLLCPAFSTVIVLFTDGEKTTVVTDSLMTTGISTEFNVLAWKICFAHPKCLS